MERAAEVTTMHADVGDRLVVGMEPERVGLIIAVPHADGTPPYVVRWLSTGHIAMVSPGQFGRIVRGSGNESKADSDFGQHARSSDAAWSGTNVCRSRGART
jgi:Domain of unknown function (DUF1918)